MEAKWEIKDRFIPEDIYKFSRQLNIPGTIGKILLNRGIDTLEKAKAFFRPSLDDLHHPFLMLNMEKSVERIITAITEKEKIMIFGDYDVDGITSVSLLFLVLLRYHAEVSYYIPDRQKEGYGLSIVGIQEAIRRGITLLISVDCGITAAKEIKLAADSGIDVIVCDHHEPGPELSEAFSVLDPKQIGCNYPFKELAGVGVTYKLCQALFTTMDDDIDYLQSFTDYVAIGSAADIVPLIDENRVFVFHGLEQLKKTEKVGIKALLESCGLMNRKVTTGQVVFNIAPRINAVGRMGNAERAVRLLTTNDYNQARNIAYILDQENRNRKNIDEETFRQAQQIVEQKYDPAENRILVLAKDGWHSGVIGIVASRIVEKYYRPTIMIAVEDGIGKGSARSIPGFDIYQALKACKDVTLTFGGHKYAAGLSIAEQNIPILRERLRQFSNDRLDPTLLIPKLSIEDEIRLGDIDHRMLKLLDLFAPFGPNNMRPVFASRNLQVVGTPIVVGSNHLRFKVRQDDRILDAIGFNLGNLLYRIAPGEKNLDIAYILEENEYMGRKTIQLRLKALR